MKKFLAYAAFFLAPAIALGPLAALGADAVITPDWAYPTLDPAYQRPKDDGSVRHVPGSTLSFTRAETAGIYASADWFPNEHPPLPEVVAHGRRPDVRACGACHLTNGMGHPDSADVAGMSQDYFIEQIRDFQNGTRANIIPERSHGMVDTAKGMTDDEIKAAAAYYAALKPAPWVTVKETDTVPATIVGVGNMRVVKDGGGNEPIAGRIIEIPENFELADLRDSHSGFIAYVPVGSIKKGEALVATGGNGKTLACGTCHGADLKGLGNAPRIAGTHPIYIVRELLDIQQGSRNGADVALMKPVAAKLSADDMVNIAAYVASRAP